jgi:hypothetical protein
VFTVGADEVVISKSGIAPKTKPALAVWVDPLVPVMGTVKLPGVGELQERVVVPEPVIGAIAPHNRPAGTLLPGERDTTPPKPFTGDTVIVDIA